MKHQNRSGISLALIPAFHIDRTGRRGASLQVISNHRSWWLDHPDAQFQAAQKQFQIRLGNSCFDSRGIDLDIKQKELSLRGTLRYGSLTPLRSNIMGPFAPFSGMQCSHGVISMAHSLEGSLTLNGEPIDFSQGTGYIETDRGRSFPSVYLWTQCLLPEPKGGSLMLAIASIPLPLGSFTGCICAILHQGREYRLATYLGAKIEEWSPSGATIQQGKYRLNVKLLEAQEQTLRAPVQGSMERSIHESLCANVSYRFWAGRDILFQHTDRRASFEFSDKAAEAKPALI